MKRTISILLIIVCLLSFFSMSAGASSDLVMRDFDFFNLLPIGYLDDSLSGVKGYSSIMIYDPQNSIYYLVVYKGLCSINRVGTYYSFSFPTSTIHSVKAYKCNGRSVFEYIKNQTLQVTIPSTAINWTVDTKDVGSFLSYNSGLSGNVSGETFDPEYKYEQWPSSWSVSYSGDKISKLTPNYTQNPGWITASEKYNLKFGADLTLKGDINVTTNGKIIGTIPSKVLNIGIQDFAIENIDYYRVPSSSDIVKTNIDYHSFYSLSSSDFLRIDNNFVYGFPISANIQSGASSYSNADLRYSGVSVYYRGYSGDIGLTCVNVNLLNKSFGRTPLDFVNTYRSHFNYPLLDYSQIGDKLGLDTNDVTNDLQSQFDSISDFGTDSMQNINDITTSINQVMPVYNGIWNIFPPWFYVIMGFCVIMVVSRKIIGR